MKPWTRVLSVLGLALLLSGCRTAPASGPATASAVPAELTKPEFLAEVIRHLYRWYAGEADVERASKDKQFVFWVRTLNPKLDTGDKSIFGEIVVPEFDLRVKVKKTDYAVEELNTVVRSPNFKITQVLR